MWTVEDPAIRPVASQGEYVIYTSEHEGGKEIAYRGRIVLPTK